MPFFSVVIPTFNNANILPQTIGSVLDQTFDDFEVLIMDDGSTDGTKDVISTIKDKRIRYYWNQNSGGPATPRNLGMDMSEGQWICFLDSDDLWHPQKLEKVFQESGKEAEVICHWEWERRLGHKESQILKYGPYESDFYKALLVKGNRVSTSATTVKKEFVRSKGLKFNQSLDYVIIEDYDFWMKLAKEGARFVFIEEVLGEYILADQNISSNKERYFHNLEIMLKNHVYYSQTFSDPDILWKQIKGRVDWEKSMTYLSNNNYWKGIPIGLKTVLSNPSMLIEKITRKILK